MTRASIMSAHTHNLKPAYPSIERITPYKTGKPIDELSRELGLTDIVKLASNENPLGCSPSVKLALQHAITDTARYPDGSGYHLKQAILTHHKSDSSDITLNQVTLGNGSNDILDLIARTFVSSQDSVVFSQYAFAVYGLVTKAVGAQGICTPAKNFAHDLEQMAAAIQPNTKLVYLANPNNPTGTHFTHTELTQFLDAVPATLLVVLDEAYVEYFNPSAYQTSLALLEKYPNLIISRTFSKAYGLASLRVGYALSSLEVADYLNRLRQPFNVNAFAQVAAVAALADQDFVAKSRALNAEQMRVLENGFEELGLAYIPSKGNFITVKVGETADAGQLVFDKLLQKGVITRPLAGYGMGQWLRVSVGLAEENVRFLQAMTSLKEAGLKEAGLKEAEQNQAGEL